MGKASRRKRELRTGEARLDYESIAHKSLQGRDLTDAEVKVLQARGDQLMERIRAQRGVVGCQTSSRRSRSWP
jgi:hypothetical protein